MEPSTRPMCQAIVCIGSNIPDCRHEMELALQWLGGILADMECHGPYPTDPEGADSGNVPYLNAVCKGGTDLSCSALKERFKAYEQLRGRTTEHKTEGKIIIDIDLVVFDGKIVNGKEYTSTYFRKGYDSLM